SPTRVGQARSQTTSQLGGRTHGRFYEDWSKMTVQPIQLEGKEYVLVPRDEFDRLTLLSNSAELPALPEADANGNYPAVEYARVSLARKIIRDRVSLGLLRKDLAGLAGMRVETLSRIESGRFTP